MLNNSNNNNTQQQQELAATFMNWKVEKVDVSKEIISYLLSDGIFTLSSSRTIIFVRLSLCSLEEEKTAVG